MSGAAFVELVDAALAEPDPTRQAALWQQAAAVAGEPWATALALSRLGALWVEDGRRDEGLEALEAAREAAPHAGFVYLAAGRSLLDVAEPAAAERWLAEGVRRLCDADPDELLEQLVGLWERALDASGGTGGKLHAQALDCLEERRVDALDALRGTGRPVTLPWHPADLWDEARAGEGLPKELRGLSHAAYCASVERQAQEMRGAGLHIVALRPIGAQEEPVGEAVPWPPGRNDACWCGSGRKYKRCCAIA